MVGDKVLSSQVVGVTIMRNECLSFLYPTIVGGRIPSPRPGVLLIKIRRILYTVVEIGWVPPCILHAYNPFLS